MSCKIEKTKLYGKIVCPPNKSYTHRAIMLASLAGGKSIIKNVPRASDTDATIEACKRFGVQIKETGDSLTIEGIKEFKKLFQKMILKIQRFRFHCNQKFQLDMD